MIFGATWSGRVETLEQAAPVVGPLINTPAGPGEGERGRDGSRPDRALRRQHVAMRPFQQTPLGRIKAGSALAGSAHLFQTIVVFENQRFVAKLRGA